MYAEKAAAIIFCVLSVMSMATVCEAEDSKEPEKVLRHAVFFKFKDGTSDEDVEKVVAAFDALPKKIDSIMDYQRGKNISPAGFDEGFTDCFMFTFDDTKGLKAYVATPAHKAVVEKIVAVAEKGRVLDFWTKEKAGGESK